MKKLKKHKIPKAPKAKNIKSDGLFKSMMEDPRIAREFLEYNLPVDFKAMIDLSTLPQFGISS